MWLSGRASRNGGYIELMGPNWQPKSEGEAGRDRKSLDAHMHWLEALTTYYEMTHHPTHRRRLLEVIDLILMRMLHPEKGLGYIHFTYVRYSKLGVSLRESTCSAAYLPLPLPSPSNLPLPLPVPLPLPLPLPVPLPFPLLLPSVQEQFSSGVSATESVSNRPKER